MNKNDNIYLGHILKSINNIERSTKNLSKREFENNEDITDATLKRIEIIGEAVKNLSKSIRKKYSNIGWQKIAGTRDVLIHAYFSVDMDLVWKIVKDDLPKLKKEIEKISKEINPSEQQH